MPGVCASLRRCQGAITLLSNVVRASVSPHFVAPVARELELLCTVRLDLDHAGT